MWSGCLFSIVVGGYFSSVSFSFSQFMFVNCNQSNVKYFKTYIRLNPRTHTHTQPYVHMYVCTHCLDLIRMLCVCGKYKACHYQTCEWIGFVELFHMYAWVCGCCYEINKNIMLFVPGNGDGLSRWRN